MSQPRRPDVQSDLDGLALNIELTLISVLQGVPLAILIPQIAALFSTGQLAQILYVPASVLVVFNVWTIFILQAISAQNWPFDLGHNLLYFLVVTAEAVMLAFLTQPGSWLLALACLGFLLAITTSYDGRRIASLIQSADTPARHQLAEHLGATRRGELLYLAAYMLVGLFGAAFVAALSAIGVLPSALWAIASLVALALPALHMRWLTGRVAERSRLLEGIRNGAPG